MVKHNEISNFFEKKFQDKVALVTGSTRGIGKDIALTLLNQGCNVMLNGKKTKNCKIEMFEEMSDYYKGDVTKPEQCKLLIKRIIKKWGKLDYVICNVGDGKTSSPLGENFEDWKKMFEINFLASVNIIKQSIPYLTKTKGSIVCISSISGIENIGAPIPYATSKIALNMFVKSMASPLAEKSIRINAIAPGNVFFEGSTWENKMKKNRKQVINFLQENVSMKRLGRPNEISPMVLFLLSDMASFMTGSIIVIDGGQTKSV